MGRSGPGASSVFITRISTLGSIYSIMAGCMYLALTLSIYGCGRPIWGFCGQAKSYYPLIYRQSDNTWLWYFIDNFSESPKETLRAFFNYSAQEWEFHPPVR